MDKSEFPLRIINITNLVLSILFLNLDLIENTPLRLQSLTDFEMCVQTVTTLFKKNFVWHLYTYQSIPAGPTHPPWRDAVIECTHA